jgi:hypothetical protein
MWYDISGKGKIGSPSKKGAFWKRREKEESRWHALVDGL